MKGFYSEKKSIEFLEIGVLEDFFVEKFVFPLKRRGWLVHRKRRRFSTEEVFKGERKVYHREVLLFPRKMWKREETARGTGCLPPFGGKGAGRPRIGRDNGGLREE